MKITLNAYSFVSAIKAALLAAPQKEDPRYYLNGIHLVGCDDGFYIEAADDHILMRAQIDVILPEEVDVILPLDFCKFIAKIRVAKRERAVKGLDLRIGGSVAGFSREVLFAYAGGAWSSNTIDSRYPDTNRAMVVRPKSDDIGDIGVSAEYLMRAGKAMATLADPKSHSVVCRGGQSPSDAFRFTVSTDHGEFTEISKPATFLVMPRAV